MKTWALSIDQQLNSLSAVLTTNSYATKTAADRPEKLSEKKED